VDLPYLTPNRAVSALPLPLYAGEVILNTTDGNMYIACPPINTPFATTHWAKYAFGLGLN
jgi:hypothetical protein